MNKIFIRRKTDGSIRGPLEIDFAFEQLKQQQSFQAYQVSKDQAQWHEAQNFFQRYMQQILKETGRLSLSQKISANRVGKYLIKSELGRGGMGVVYLAYDPEFERKCAIKVLLNSENVRANKRFAIEARAMARFQHENIAKIYDIQEHPKRYFVMEYVEGCTLKDALENKHLSLKNKLHIFCQICDGVAYAHRNKIIHRDLKPVNILLDKNNVPKILDFGIAKQMSNETEITKTGEVIGTPKYLAPEVIRGAKASYKSDLYSLAVILYEILTGNSPFHGDSALEIMYAISTQSPPVPSEVDAKVPVELDLLCMKCLDKDPDYRLESVAFLRKEIERFLNNKPIVTRKFSYIYRTKKWIQRNPYQTILGIFLLAVSIIFYVALDFSSRRLRVAKVEHSKANRKYEEANQKYKSAYDKLTKARFDAVENLMEKSKFYDAFHQLGEVYDDQEDFSQKEYIKKANFLLEYSILPSLPQVHVYPKKTKNILQISPQSVYFYTSDENSLYLWKKPAVDKIFDKKNCWFKIPLPEINVQKRFSYNAQYLAIHSERHIVVYDIKNKKKLFEVFAQKGVFALVEISANGKYIAYGKRLSSKKVQVTIVEIATQKARTIYKSVGAPWTLLFSPDSKWIAYTEVVEQQATEYKIVIYNIKSNLFAKESMLTTPNIKFSTDGSRMYVNNRSFADTTRHKPQIIPRSKKDLQHNDSDEDFLILENTRIYQESTGGIIHYDERSNTKTKFNLDIQQLKFDFSKTFLVAKGEKAVALWSTDSSKLCFYYRDEQQPTLGFVPQSHTFYMNQENSLRVYHLFDGLKSIDFLEQTSKLNEKILRIQFGKNKQQNLVVDNSNAMLETIKNQVKNKEGLFSTLDIYNKHPAICKNNIIVLLSKGSLSIYDRKSNNRFFLILPGTRFITANMDEENLYYIRRDYLGFVMGKINTSQLLKSKVSDHVGREQRLKQDGYNRSRIVFYRENIIAHRRDSIVVFDKEMQQQKEIEVKNILDFTINRDRFYATAHNMLVTFQMENEKIVEMGREIFEDAFLMNQVVVSANGKYIAIANKRGKQILFAEMQEDKITSIKRIHHGNVHLLSFHPFKPILAIFDPAKITLYHCEEGYSCEYRKELALGRIATFDPKWETLITEVPHSMGVNLFPMKINYKDYQYFLDQHNIPVREIFNH